MVVYEYSACNRVSETDEICVDAIGFGAVAARQLREALKNERVIVTAVNVAETGAKISERYVSKRVELWAMGREWFEQYADEVYRRDSVYARGHSAKPPRYFDKMLEAVDPVLATEVRHARAREADLAEGTEERLQVREMCRRSRFTLQQRRLG